MGRCAVRETVVGEAGMAMAIGNMGTAAPRLLGRDRIFDPGNSMTDGDLLRFASERLNRCACAAHRAELAGWKGVECAIYYARNHGWRTELISDHEGFLFYVGCSDEERFGQAQHPTRPGLAAWRAIWGSQET